jgi:hypothetical protein
MTRQLATNLCAIAVALVLTAPSNAGTIIGVANVSGGGNAVVDPILSGDPNNDNSSVPANSNMAVASKIFSANAPIDIVFDVQTSQGTTEYRLSEGVANVTGVDFLMYEFELGFGTGASFVRSAAGDGLDFDAPNIDPGPTSARFLTMAHQEDQVRFSDGTFPTGMTDAYTISVDVPDFNAAAMPASAATATGYRFTLRQRGSIIPEPGTIAIVILSALAWAVYSLRRRWG